MIKYSFMIGALAMGLLSACGGSGTSETGGNISIDGSSTVYPISEAVAEDFRTVNSKVNVTVGESGTGGGMQKFTRGEIDICDASRRIKEKEIAKADSAGIKILELEIAYDGLAVVVNIDNSWVDKLTTAELKMVWESAAQGNVTKWNQIRADWPDEELHLYGPGTASGTYEYFTEAICGEKGNSRGDYTASEDDNVLVQGVAGDKGGLGYFGMAYYEANKDKLRVVPIDNGNGNAVIPTQETVLNKTYAPLSRPLFIYVSLNALARPEVKQFVDYYIDNVAQLSKEVGYVPLQPEMYTDTKQKLSAAEAK
ncbi:MAG: PstS family phosphate ABC transporter substrate-binding protein [Chitinophagales bacterium]